MGVRGAVGQLLWLRGPEGGDEKEKQHSDTLLGVCWRGNLEKKLCCDLYRNACLSLALT